MELHLVDCPSFSDAKLSSSLTHSVKILVVKIDEESDNIIVNFSEEKNCLFPAVFLRDNCLCYECFDHSSFDKKLLVADLDVDVRARSVRVETTSDDNHGLIITWEDGHRSSFSANWLYSRRFTLPGIRERLNWYKKKPELWGADLKGRIPTDTFKNVISDDIALFDWVTDLEVTGLHIMKDAPKENGQLRKLGDKISFLHQCTYGTEFQIRSKSNPSSISYTTGPIGMHVDQPYTDFVPGITMLHYIKQAKQNQGGENGFVDGFLVALQLKKINPEYFNILSTTLVDFWDFGIENKLKFFSMSRKPIISTNRNDEVTQIVYNPQSFGSFLNVPPEKVKLLYKAIKAFENLMNSTEFKVEFKAEEGDIICFDNHRLLHCRAGFVDTKGEERHIEGAYVDWDELLSRKRVIKLEKGLTDYFTWRL